MRTRIRAVVATFGWWQWTLAAVFLVALVLAALFTVRTVTYTLYWREHRNQPIERWMTVGYVAHSYGLPREVLEEAVHGPGGAGAAALEPPAARRPPAAGRDRAGAGQDVRRGARHAAAGDRSGRFLLLHRC